MFPPLFSGSKKVKGFTISELLVSSFLLLLIFGLTYQMLIPAKKFWLLGDTRSEVQLNARLAFEKISRDLQSSTYNSVTIASGHTPALSMLSARNPTNDTLTINSQGQLVWQKYIIYYIPSGDNRMFRREATNANVPSATPTPLTAVQVQSYCDGTGRVVAYVVSTLTAVTNPSSSSITLTVATQKELFSKTNTSVITNIITLEN